MRTSRLAAAAAAATLTLFGTGAAAFAVGATPAPAPTVTSSGSNYTVDVAGVGMVTFTLDAGGTPTNVGFTPAASGATTPETEVSVAIPVSTGSTASPQMVNIEIDRENGAVQVKVESQATEDGNDQGDTATSNTAQQPTVTSSETDKPEAPETTEAPKTTEAPETTEAPKTTEAPETTETPKTTEAPEAEKSGSETDSQPQVTTAPAQQTPSTTEAGHQSND